MLSFIFLLSVSVLWKCKGEVIVMISQPHGQRILNLAEVQLMQGGQALPDYLMDFSFSADTEPHNSAHFCKDSDILTSCQNSLVFNTDSGAWEGAEIRPTLFIRLVDAFFDTLIISPRPGREHLLVGAEVTLLDNDRPVQLDNNIFRFPNSQYSIDMSHLMVRQPQSRMRITDTILYNGDLIALTRIKYLFDVIDEFIIVESWITFSGQSKSHLYFLEPEVYSGFQPYMHKIKYVVIKSIPDVPSSYAGPPFKFLNESLPYWWRETFTRSYFRFFVRPYSNEAVNMFPASDVPPLYLITDCDEIPSKQSLINIKNDQENFIGDDPLHIEMNLFNYNLHWFADKYWILPYMINDKGLFGLSDVSAPRNLPGGVRGFGWHCSSFMSVSSIIKKVEAFSHQEYNTEAIKDKGHIKKCISEGLDMYRSDDDVYYNFRRLEDDYLIESIPSELYDFHLEVLSIQNSDDPV